MNNSSFPRSATAAVVAAGVLLAVASASPSLAATNASTASSVVTITVLSGRGDLVSGGTSLLRVSLPPGANGLHVTAGRRDVTSAFGKADDGTLEGLVTGLPVGRTVVTAAIAGGRGARITLTNHPVGGPTFSGPQIQPWACQAGALDAQCDAPTVVTYKYLPVGTNPLALNTTGQTTSALMPYDPSNPTPTAAIATTTTDTGKTVPFIVREETGYSDRDQFATAVVDDPATAWTPLHEQAQWNRKLVLTHGSSCDTTYGTGTAPSVEDVALLGHGYVLASHALDNAGHNCNIATEAEALIMTKEHVIKTYGAIRWTIGSGCSGGSLAQQQVANAYPGVYQAITPQCSFTDAWSSAMEFVDYNLFLTYLQDPARSAADAFGPLAIQAVLDHPNPANPVTFTTVIPNSASTTRTCPGVPAGGQYNPTTNPGGVKCDLSDYMVNVFGKKADGFANRPFDNVGVQYGLAGLAAGTVSPQQFADLNSKIGGIDEAGTIDPAHRVVADPVGLDRVYTSGAVDETTNLDQVAIIDLRGPDYGTFHDVYRTYALRARLMNAHGTAANQVLWRGQVDLIGDASYADQAVVAADTWVAAYEADTRPVPLAQKIIQDKPAALTARCTDGAGTDAPAATCDATVISFGTPRMAGGMPLADDIIKCQLAPLNRARYAVTFTDAQWAELVKAFPTGVCDYTKPGVDQHGTTPWLAYDIPGGHPMGLAPVSTPFGPTSVGTTTALPGAANGRHATAPALPTTGGLPLAVPAAALLTAAGVTARRRRRKHRA